MSLQETIKSIIAQFGESVLDDPLRLLGLLEDYHAFEMESPESRTTMREMVREGKVRNMLVGNTQNPYGSLTVQPSIVKVLQVDKCGKVKSLWSHLKKWTGKNRGKIWDSIIIGIILILALLVVVSLFSVFCGLILGWANTESWAWTFFWSVIAGLIALGIGEMTVE